MHSCRHSIENTFAPRRHTRLRFEGKHREKHDADSRDFPSLAVKARGSQLALCCADMLTVLRVARLQAYFEEY